MSHKKHGTTTTGMFTQNTNTDFGEAKPTKLQQSLEERKTSEILQLLQEMIANDSIGKP